MLTRDAGKPSRQHLGGLRKSEEERETGTKDRAWRTGRASVFEESEGRVDLPKEGERESPVGPTEVAKVVVESRKDRRTSASP